MTNDLANMTKDAINALLATPLTPAQLKKVSKHDLIARFDAMPASDGAVRRRDVAIASTPLGAGTGGLRAARFAFCFGFLRPW